MDQYERHMFELKEWQRTSFFIPSWAKAENMVCVFSLLDIWKMKEEEITDGWIRKKCLVTSVFSYIKNIVNRLACK